MMIERAFKIHDPDVVPHSSFGGKYDDIVDKRRLRPTSAPLARRTRAVGDAFEQVAVTLTPAQSTPQRQERPQSAKPARVSLELTRTSPDLSVPRVVERQRAASPGSLMLSSSLPPPSSSSGSVSRTAPARSTSPVSAQRPPSPVTGLVRPPSAGGFRAPLAGSHSISYVRASVPSPTGFGLHPEHRRSLSASRRPSSPVRALQSPTIVNLLPVTLPENYDPAESKIKVFTNAGQYYVAKVIESSLTKRRGRTASPSRR